MENNNWKEKFKSFSPLYTVESFGLEDYRYVHEEVKSFIENLLAEQKKEILKNINKIKKIDVHDDGDRLALTTLGTNHVIKMARDDYDKFLTLLQEEPN